MTLCSAGLDYTNRNEGSNWTHKGGSPSSLGRTAGDICWGLWDLYWKPLRELDISDRREQDKQLKNDENWEENETLEGRIVLKILVHVRVQRGWWCWCTCEASSLSRSRAKVKVGYYP